MLNREYPSPEQLHHLYLLLFLGLIVITFTHSQKQSPSTLHSLLSVTNQYHILHLFFFFLFPHPFSSSSCGFCFCDLLLVTIVVGNNIRRSPSRSATSQQVVTPSPPCPGAGFPSSAATNSLFGELFFCTGVFLMDSGELSGCLPSSTVGSGETTGFR